MGKEQLFWKISQIGKTANKIEAQKLFNKGVSVDTKGFLNYTMLGHAISYLHETQQNVIPKEQRLDFIEFLLQKGASLNLPVESWVEVPFLNATSSNIAPDILALFLKHGAEVNTAHQGWNALSLAAWNGRIDVVKFLLAQPTINIDSVDHEGCTPLMRASFWGYANVVDELLKNGAKADIKDHSERTVLDYVMPQYSDESLYSEKRLETLKVLAKYDPENVMIKKAIESYKP